MVQDLNLDPHIDQPDDFYEALIKLHEGLTEDQSRDVNARLILILANQVGDLRMLEEAFRLARKGIQ